MSREILEGATRIRCAQVLEGIKRGLQFTPLNGKKPIRPGWQKEPPPSSEKMLEWAQQGNIGVRTGAASGIIVIDEDTAKGGSVAALGLPETPTVNTGGGGRHMYFAHPGGKLGNSAGKLAANVDVRGDGGQAVFVGSVHPESGEVYKWAPGLSPDDVGLAELPPAVLAVLRGQAPSKAAVEGERKLKRACELISGAPVGTRNETLNRQAFIVGLTVQTRAVSETDAIEQIRAAASRSGLEPSEIDDTLLRAIREGKAEAKGRSADGRPEIYVKGGDLPTMADSAEETLLHDGHAPLYEFGSALIRLLRSPTLTVRQGFGNAVAGLLIMVAVDLPYLVDRLTRVAKWLRWDERAGTYKRVDCPDKVARTVLARNGFRNAPQLVGIICAPTLRPDGSILAEPGYDPDTRLYFDPGSTDFPVVPESPSRDDAKCALAVIEGTIEQFPWVDGSDRSAAVAAILTALVRRSLRTAPLFAFRAPKMGTGKSLLADVVSLIATGTPAAVMSQGRDEDESRKRMLALLMEGSGVISIDNIERPLGDPVLCSILTQELWKDRVLGATKTATVPTTSTWLATGNNLEFSGDITTRVIPCDLDAKCERPEERKFQVDLYKYIPEHRGELVSAGLTVLRAYHVAGRPDQGLPVFGRFEDWSNLVRSPLVWCGREDPNLGRARLENYDSERRQIQAVLALWYAVFEKRILTTGDVVAFLAGAELSDLQKLFKEELVSVAGDRSGDLDSRRLGHWLVKRERRIEKGLRVERVGQRQNAMLWQVAAVGELGESRELS